MKRIFDMVCSFVGLILLSPVLGVVAACILVGDGWPVLFRQTRVGRYGRPFVLFKFRTMRAPDSRGRISDLGRPMSETGATFDAGNRSRVTRVGRVLRKWKLDELPQLWNVLNGEMSLVGPRPEIHQWVEAYPEQWARVLTVQPGITDPASIEFRNEEELLARADDPQRHYREVILPRKLDLYEAYVRTRSFFGDVGIILRTLAALGRDGK
jgi:lipopolysaccharide/colanic/teichoic acid biosynthesis glycosyltransferase